MVVISYAREEINSEIRRVLHNTGSLIDLSKITFVGEEPNDFTIATLPHTFPNGEERYRTWKLVTKEKAEGRSLTNICAGQNLPYNCAKDYYYGHVPRSIRSVQAAEAEGTLPFDYHNERIDFWNSLLALSWWSGCITNGWVQIAPNGENGNVLEQLLQREEYTPNSSSLHHYVVHKDIYLVMSAALARTFASLGMPLQEGKKTTIDSFSFPWYVEFMRGKYFREGQQFDEVSQLTATRFLQQFCYGLLSDRTNSINMSHGLSIELISTGSEENGRMHIDETAEVLTRAFPGLQRRDLRPFCSKLKDSWRNRIYIYNDPVDIILELLEQKGGKPNQELLLHLQVREMASRALLAK